MSVCQRQLIESDAAGGVWRGGTREENHNAPHWIALILHGTRMQRSRGRGQPAAAEISYCDSAYDGLGGEQATVCQHIAYPGDPAKLELLQPSSPGQGPLPLPRWVR